MSVKGYFIQYRFITPEETKHSSYGYQKLFRALYGYTQAVDKSSGKRYRYHRKGVLSDIPHIRPRKNCVIIPQEHFQKLIEFFKTGKNPTHAWRGKGDWKAVYYMNEKNLGTQDVVAAFEGVINKELFQRRGEEPHTLATGLKYLSEKGVSQKDLVLATCLLASAKDLFNLEWFKDVQSHSDRLSEVYSNYKAVRQTIGQ